MLSSCFSEPSSYEAAAYTPIESDGAFELRQYGMIKTVSAPIGAGRNGAFMDLFRYISANNAANEKIAMTVPVFMDMETADDRMHFVLPNTYQTGEQEIPGPGSSAVTVDTIEGGTFAILKFSGASSEQDKATQLAKLRQMIADRGFEATGHPIYAGYSSPRVPVAKRKNEVLLRIKSPDGGPVAEKGFRASAVGSP